MPEISDPPKRRGRPPKVKAEPTIPGIDGMLQEAWERLSPNVLMVQLVNTVRLVQNEQQSIHASPACKLTLTDHGIVAEQTNGQDKRTIVVPFSNVRFYQLA